MEQYTTIKLRRSTRNKLAAEGGKDDTFDGIVQKLLEKCGEQRRALVEE